MPSTYGGMIVHDGIGPILDVAVAEAGGRVLAAMESGKERIEAYAKENAPWDDRTGDARAGLITSVEEDGGFIILELAHTVDYGVWLETIEDGSFAIIMPTLEALGPEVIREAGGEVLHIGPSFGSGGY